MKQTITSRENPRIKAASALVSSAKERRVRGLFAIEGLRLCTDAVKSGVSVREVYFTESFEASFPEAAALLSDGAQACFSVSESVMDRLSDTSSPQGVFALCETPRKSLPGKGRFLILDRVADPSNLGAAARTAEALGMDGILLSADCCDPFNPKALRASMGAFFRIPCEHTADLSERIKELRRVGFSVFGSVVTGGDDVRRTEFSSPCALVIGNEANGISDSVRESCTALVNIRMAGRAESLNASAAAAILMWEMMREL